VGNYSTLPKAGI